MEEIFELTDKGRDYLVKLDSQENSGIQSVDEALLRMINLGEDLLQKGFITGIRRDKSDEHGYRRGFERLFEEGYIVLVGSPRDQEMYEFRRDQAKLYYGDFESSEDWKAALQRRDKRRSRSPDRVAMDILGRQREEAYKAWKASPEYKAFLEGLDREDEERRKDKGE